MSDEPTRDDQTKSTNSEKARDDVSKMGDEAVPDDHAKVGGGEAVPEDEAKTGDREVRSDNQTNTGGSESTLVNKPNAASPTATYAPTEHSKPVEERLGELRRDLLADRRHRRLLVANAVMAVFGVTVICGEVTALATGLIQHQRVTVAILFAVSSAAALGGVFLALARFADAAGQTDKERFWCRTLLGTAALLAVVGAFVAAWPK